MLRRARGKQKAASLAETGWPATSSGASRRLEGVAAPSVSAPEARSSALAMLTYTSVMLSTSNSESAMCK